MTPKYAFGEMTDSHEAGQYFLIAWDSLPGMDPHAVVFVGNPLDGWRSIGSFDDPVTSIACADYAVYCVSQTGKLLKYCNGVWEISEPFGMKIPTKIRVLSGNVIIGAQGLFWRSGSKGLETIKLGTHKMVFGFAESGEKLYVVCGGGHFFEVQGDVAKRIDLQVIDNLCGVAPLRDGSLVIVGWEGTILKYRNGKIQTIESGVSWNLLQVIENGKGQLYCIGEGILKVGRDHKSVEKLIEPSDEAYFGNGVLLPNDELLVVGDPEVMLVGPPWRKVTFRVL